MNTLLSTVEVMTLYKQGSLIVWRPEVIVGSVTACVSLICVAIITIKTLRD